MIDATDPTSAELRQASTRRARFALRRLAWLVPTARVRLSAVQSARGTTYQRCQVILETYGRRTVAATAIARDWRAAMDQAFRSAGRAVLRMWEAPPLRHRLLATAPGRT